MYEFMEVDFNNADELLAAEKYWYGVFNDDVKHPWLKLDNPITEEAQRRHQALWRAYTFASARISLLERDRRDAEIEAKKPFWKKIFKK